MTFLAPGWLWLIVPWLLLAIWMWRRPARQLDVPARFLWSNRRTSPARFAVSRLPAMWVIFVLSALLLCILVVAGLSVVGHRPRLIIIVDPAVGLNTTKQGRSIADELVARIERESQGADIQLIRPRVTARDTAGWLHAEVARAARDSHYAVAVATDKRLSVPGNSNIAVVTPSERIANTGIISIAITPLRFSANERSSPAQLMARLVNTGEITHGTLLLRSDGTLIHEEPIELPSGETTRFITIDTVGDRVTLDLVVADDPLPIDNTATLLRSSDWPQLLVEGSPPRTATRYASTYAARRPGLGPMILLTDQDDTSVAAMIFAPVQKALVSNAVLQLSGHSLTQDVALDKATIGRTTMSPPGQGWTTVASIDGEAILAYRESPARQVWIGLALPEDELSFVVLLSNAVDWISAGAEPIWMSASPDDVERDWMPLQTHADVEFAPGIYQDESARRVAVNVSAILRGEGADVRNVAAILEQARSQQAESLHVPLAIAAALLLIGSGWLIRSDRFP